MERVSKIIANSGYASRRNAEELIKKGKVLVNGKVCVLGEKADSNDIISVDGIIINKEENFVYYLLNKPRGVVSTTVDEKGRKTVIDLIDVDKRIYPIGRLDYDTTGALLLTNDGMLTNKLLHPSNKIDKVYLAKIEGIIKGIDINKLKDGIKIDNYIAKPTRIKLRSFNKKNNTSLVEVVLHEGHNHEVKKMFEEIGFDVIKLTRISFAGLTVKSLKSGEYRKLTVKEVKKLYSLVK